MTISKKLQKILAVTLMTSFLSTSFVMGMSEAAAARHNGGGRYPAQSQQIRLETRKGPSGHQMKAPMQRSSGQQARPVVHKNTPAQRMQSMHKGSQAHQGHGGMHKGGTIRHGGPMMHRSSPNHRTEPVMHKGGTIRHGGPVMHRSSPNHRTEPVMHRGGTIRHDGPVIHRSDPNHRTEPVMHRGGTIQHGGPIIQQHHPAPPPRHHHHDDYRSMHSGDWIGALIVGGILGAIIANNSHRVGHHDYVEYVE